MLQFWLIQNFTKDVSSKIGEAAFEVSRSTIQTLIFQQPNRQLKSYAISTKITAVEQVELLNTLTNIPNDINISLKDGQKDQFITLNSAGSSQKIDIPRTGIEKSLDAMSQKILMSAFAFIFIGLLAASYFSRRLSQPLKDLQIASDHVGRGDFGFQVANQNKLQSIELTNTIAAFNEMSHKIEGLQKENEKLQKQAQLSELAEITRGLAHTIRNPLNTLNLAIDELSSTNNETSKKDLTRISKHQVQRIDKWVRSLMDIMSSDSSLVESVAIDQLLKSCIDDISLNNTGPIPISLKALNHGQNKTREFCIQAIKPELKSLLQSLISNSVEANEAASSDTRDQQAHTVNIELSRSVETVKIIISDNGVGFSDEIMKKLFSPHNTNKTYGAGMGLYLAHRIITLKYNGNIQITDNPEQTNSSHRGARIELTLNNRV